VVEGSHRASRGKDEAVTWVRTISTGSHGSHWINHLRYRGVESEMPLPKIGGGGDQSAGKGSFRYEERSDEEEFDDIMT
jgi:hypothetical protein